MKRFLSVLAAVAFALAPASSAQAVNSLSASFVIECNDPDGSSTADPLGITMPTGWYAVEITGACFLAYPGLDGCHVLAYAYTGGCGAPQTVGSCTMYHVAVDGQCPTLGGAGLIYHGNGGPITARVVDCCYADNVGSFVVTVTWTVL